MFEDVDTTIRLIERRAENLSTFILLEAYRVKAGISPYDPGGLRGFVLLVIFGSDVE